MVLRVSAWLPGGRELAIGCLLASLGCPRPGLAQDLIVRTDSTRITARVLAVNAAAISYQNWDDATAPITRLSTDYVRYIRYQSGAKLNFATVAPQLPVASVPQKRVNLGRSVVSLRPADLLYANATLSYELLVGAKGRIGVKVPLTMKLGAKQTATHDTWGYYQSNKIFGTGLELNFYSGPPARFRYFFGPAFQYGRFRYRSGEEYLGNLDFFGIDLGPVYTYKEGVGEHFAVLLNNGIWYQVGKRFVFSADAGVGWQIKVLDQTLRNLNTEELAGSRVKIAANINFGYQF